MNILIWASSSNDDIATKSIPTFEVVFSKPTASPMLGQALKMSLRVPFVLISDETETKTDVDVFITSGRRSSSPDCLHCFYLKHNEKSQKPV